VSTTTEELHMKTLQRMGMAVAIPFLMGALATRAEEPAASPEGEPVAQFIGAEACGKCHKRASTGNQLAQWRASRHATAYETLGTPEAAAVAKKAGIAGNPQESPECLRCHVTAHGVDAAAIAEPAEGKAGFQVSDGVQCESCHGAGSLYKSRKVMKDHEASVAAGLVVPDEKLCSTCHNNQSPTFESFNFEEMWNNVQHPNPKKAAAEAGG